MKTTLQVYKVLSGAAGDLNRLAVQLREEQITKAEAEEKAKQKIEELATLFA